MDTSADIYALCYCSSFDMPLMQSRYLVNQRCVAYRNVQHVEWRQGEVFIFDYGVLVFWGLSAEERNDFVQHIHEFANEPLSNTTSLPVTKSTATHLYGIGSSAKL